ncbi:uncharacterized protein LOC117603630 isoform X2 [Osmia lignaria lignaria]|nr:uncharacterized protein LOC117603630 isoform X2 [Osmia lignaria]XP_034178852.1 uncharacterized protein LOC117603630 isoform X2 [Osmia lignaria]
MTEEDTLTDSPIIGKICVMLANVKEAKANDKSYGFHLTKSKWDPYPWVSYVETGSFANVAGLRAGDCLISIDGQDLIGLKVKQIAGLIQQHQQDNIKLFVWRNINDENQDESGIAIKGPLPEVASKLANALSGVVRVLECPVCLESSLPPVSQCVHGHIICVECRSRTPRCPICRVRLGQGRCLLADKLHKIFRDVFNMNDIPANVERRTQSLRDRLFGKCKKKTSVPVTGKDNNSVNSKARQLLLTKLFRIGMEKAASADNLITTSNETLNANKGKSSNFHDCLNLHDRVKSASTGELSKDTTKNINEPLQIYSTATSSTTSLISSVSATPVWGGSMNSVSSMQISCPLAKQSGCKDIITSDTVLEHLSVNHELPQVHFYSVHIKLPFPLPFGSEAVYILHYSEDVFFFQCEREIVWISSAIGDKIVWEWILHGQGENGTEIKMRRNVVSLVNPTILTPQHIAPLPNTLLLHTLNIQLRECHSYEQLGV